MNKVLLIFTFMICGIIVNAQITNDFTYRGFNGSFNSAYGVGDLHAPYKNNLYNRYLIAPVGAARIKLNIYNHDFGNNSSADHIYVYDGYDDSWPLLASFSSDNPPTADTIYSTGNIISIFFETDNISYGEYGWLAEYFGVKPVPTVYTSASGIFNEGITSTMECMNLQLKTYLIRPEGASKIELAFPIFQIESAESFMWIYDGDNENANLIAAYPSMGDPTTIESTGNSLFIKFLNTYDCSHWTAQYTGILQKSSVSYQYDATGNREHRNVIILKSAKAPGGKNYGPQNNSSFQGSKPQQEKNGNQDIIIYPNPTEGQLKVDITGFDAVKKSAAYVYDPMGKLIVQKSPLTGSDVIDLSAYPNGLFLMQIVLGDKVSEWKIIKE